MGAPESGMTAGDQPTADSMLGAFRTIKDADRIVHAQVLDYWLSIRGDKEFPPLHDLDPLEISDAAGNSILFELLSGGQDAEIRHCGDALKEDVTVQRIIDAPSPSLLSSIARKLPIVGISRDFLAFEDNFSNADGLTRCWITMLPLSSCGSWVDYVYAFVTLDKASTKSVAAKTPDPVVEEQQVQPESDAQDAEPELAVTEEPVEETAAEPEAPVAEVEESDVAELVEPVEERTEAEQPGETVEEPAEAAAEQPETVEDAPVEVASELEPAPDAEPETGHEPEDLAEEPEPPKSAPGFSRILEGLSQLTGFYGQGVKVEEPVVEVGMADSLPPLADPEPSAAPDLDPLELEEVAAVAEPEPEPQIEPEPQPEEPETAEAAPLELDVPAPALEGALQNKLTEVRAKADEARAAALRATAALHEGLSAAYDFALDAETSPEEYLRLVEAQGLKIQLRAPMAPVAKLAFNGLVDDATLGQMEKILAWALKEELPRGELLGRIDQAGGLSELAGQLRAA